MTITVKQFIDQNIIYCVSTLVYELAQKGCLDEEIHYQLYCGPIDYDAAKYELQQEGDTTFKYLCPEDNQYYWGVQSEHLVWKIDPIHNDEKTAIYEWFELYGGGRLDEYRQEIFEHWICSDYLRRKLKEQDHTVVEVLGLTIWARPTTNQAIYMDYVIQEIYNELISK